MMNISNCVHKIIVFFCLWCGTGVATGLDMPPAWPWRGVNIDSINYDVSKLKQVLRTIKINSVQLRLRPRRLAEENNLSPDKAWEQSLAWADSMLDECKREGIVAILSVEDFPIDPTLAYNQTSPSFWFSKENRKDVLNLASDLSGKFTQRGPELAAYQFLSEPVMIIGGKSYSPPEWDLFIVDLIKTIRKNDSDRWIAVAPAPWGLPSSYKKYELLPFEHIVYGAHMYEPHIFTHQGVRKYKERYSYPGIMNGKEWDREQLISAMSHLRAFQVKHKVPVWIGEFSAIRWAQGGEQYISDLVSIFNELNWAWTYFSLNGWHGWNPDYNEHQPIGSGWKAQNIGVASKRWETLEHVFNARPNN